MDLRIGTSTPAPRSVTADSPAPLGPLKERYLGDLVGPAASDRREPMFAGARVGASEGYANAREAATALAEVTDGRQTPAAVLVQRPGSERVDAYVLEAPVWKKSWFRTEVVGSEPASVIDPGSNPGGLTSGVVAWGSAGSVDGRLETGKYGPQLGTVVGIVDDTWGRLADEGVDLGVPFDASSPSTTGAVKPDSKSALAKQLGSLADSLDIAADSLYLLAGEPRKTTPASLETTWSDLRDGAATLEQALAFPGLPDAMRSELEQVRAATLAADKGFSSQGRLTPESTAWASSASSAVNAGAASLRRLSQSPWITDLDKGEVAKVLATALGAADSRIGRSIGQLLAVPKTDASNETYLPLRKEARALNLAAQEQLETLFERKGVPKSVLSALRSADASLEDATWQIVGKPSPDGRFNGLDLPGAIESERTAREALRKLAGEYEIDLGDATEPTPDAPKPQPKPDPKPTPTPDPKPGVDPVIARDVKQALTFLAKSADSLASIPNDAQEAETWLPTRKSARQDNLDAQKLLEDRFLDPRTPQAIVSTLRRADATLEDVTWQIVGKPSPDGRFNGVDIPGALGDTRAAIKLLEGLVAS